MTIHRLTRRTVLEGAAALGAIGCLPARLAAQSGRAEPLPARGDIVIRGANVLTMDERLGDFASGDVHVRDGAIVAVGANVNVSGAEVIDGRGTDLHARLRRYPLAPVDQHAAAVRPLRYRRAERISRSPPASGSTMTPEDSLCQRAARHRRGAERRRDHGAQLGAQHAQPRARRRRARRHARRRHPRPLRLRPGRRACRTTSRWTSPDSRASNATGCPATACSRSASARATSAAAASAARRAASSSTDMARKDWGGARELGLPITLHTSGPSPIKALEEAGLLGPDVQLVHPLLTTPEERAILKARGVSYSIAPAGEGAPRRRARRRSSSASCWRPASR